MKLEDFGIRRNGTAQLIAEIGINHGGDLNKAMEIVKLAIGSGVRLIKHQTHIAEAEMSFEAKTIIPKHCDQSIFDIIKDNSLSLADEVKLKEYVESLGAVYFSTPFSLDALEFLCSIDIPLVKIGSGELSNMPLIKEVARLRKPIILSTGMAGMTEVYEATEILTSAGTEFALMHCTNLYPAPPDTINLGAITELRDAFPQTPIGYSDHSVGAFAALAAMGLGACIVEKHFCGSLDDEGPDIKGSMDSKMAKTLIEGAGFLVEAKFGKKGVYEFEQDTRDFAYASVVAKRAIIKGEPLTSDNLCVKRPSGGIPARDFDRCLGKKARRNVERDRQLTRDDI